MVPRVEIVIEDTGSVRIMRTYGSDLLISNLGHVGILHPREALPSFFTREAVRPRDRTGIGYWYGLKLCRSPDFLTSYSSVDIKVTRYRRHDRCTLSCGLWYTDGAEVRGATF